MTTVTRNGVRYEETGVGELTPHVRLVADDTTSPPYGQALLTSVWGTAVTKAIFTSGDVFIVDMRAFGKATFAVFSSAAVMVYGATVAWSHDGGAETHSAGTALLTGVTGDKGAAMTILDNFAHITITRDATSESIYAYVSGRELA